MTSFKQETVFKGHTSRVLSLAVTSDNKYIISGSSDHTIIVWNFLEKTQETVLQGYLGVVTTIEVTSDNKYVVSCSFIGETIRVWNLLEKRQETVLQGHQQFCTN